MSRKPRVLSQSGYYHFINRGINKKKIFHRKEDYSFYRGLLIEYSRQLDLKIVHYCVLSNHSHLLVHASELKSLSLFGHFIQRRYAYYYSKVYHWAEQLFKKPFLSIPIETDAYLLECARYIERNPLNAHLIKDLKEYAHSSYNHYAHGKEDALLTPNPLYVNLGRTLEERQAAYQFYVCQPRQKEEQMDPF